MMIDRDSPLPLYHQIKESIRGLVTLLKPHMQIPSEQELMATYGVSRGTIQKSISELVNEGVLYRMQGKGTFVAPLQISQSLSQISSFADELVKLGMKPDVRHVSVDRVLPDVKVAHRLQVDRSTPVWRVERLRLADSEPIAFTTSFIPVSIAPTLSEEDSVGISIYKTLTQKFNVRLVSACDQYQSVPAGECVERALCIPPGSPILRLERIAYTYGHVPVESNVAEVRGDRYVLRIGINVEE